MTKDTLTTSLTDQLREAIADSGETLYRVAKASGISYPALHRFMGGDRDLKFAVAAKVAAYLGLSLTKTL